MNLETYGRYCRMEKEGRRRSDIAVELCLEVNAMMDWVRFHDSWEKHQVTAREALIGMLSAYMANYMGAKSGVYTAHYANEYAKALIGTVEKDMTKFAKKPDELLADEMVIIKSGERNAKH